MSFPLPVTRSRPKTTRLRTCSQKKISFRFHLPKPVTTQWPETKGRKVADDLMVTNCVRRLRAATHDRATFGHLVLEMKADKIVRVPKAVAVAAQYAGKRSKSRKDALEGLARRFVGPFRTRRAP
jgi:hypothetical protein